MQLDLAEARQARITAVADRAANRAAVLWRQRMTSDFDSSWGSLTNDVTGLAAAGQVAVAAAANPYLAATARSDHMVAPDSGISLVQPAAFAGVDASGRTLDGLLYGSVTTAKSLVGRGSGLQTALQAGSIYLQTMVATAITDTARSADLTAMTARRYTRYIRVVSAGACSRCAILAGIGSAREAFQRHPRCRCTSAPITVEEKTPAATRFSSPTAYFESLPPAEQERIFTKAGAEAIRAGADPVAVVSARRGAPGTEYSKTNRTVAHSGRRLERTVIGHRTDGTPILGYTTGEGTSIRGAYGRRQRTLDPRTQKVGTRYSTVKRIRLMPETIIALTDDVALRTVLLRDAGYLDVPVSAAEQRANIGAYLRRRDEVLRQDRATADAFYRQHGITLA